MLQSQLRKAAKSFDHSCIFEMSNKSDETNALVHQKIKGVLAHGCATSSKDAQVKESLNQSTNKRRSMSKVTCIAGKKEEEHRKHMILNGNTKVELQCWCPQKRVGLER